jgi:hypothetical protein
MLHGSSWLPAWPDGLVATPQYPRSARAPNLEQDEVLGAGVVEDLPAGLPAVAAPAEAHDFAQQADVGLVSVQAVHAVAQIGLVPRAALGQTHVLHDLVLSLTRHVVA